MNEAHLEDAELRHMAQRLGAGAAELLDVERVAASVVERLRAQPAPRAERRWWIQPRWLRAAAAAVVLVVGAGVLLRGWSGAGGNRHPAHYVADELQDLSADQLRQVLGSLDQTLNDPVVEPSDEDLNDLTTDELQALLRSLEG
jgi:anti-sigma factor RsiW